MKIRPKLKEELKKYLLQKQQEEASRAVITSAYKLGEDEVQGILERFPELKNRKIEQNIDPSLLAGVVIKYGTKILDLSLKNRLNSLEQTLHEIA